MKDNLLTLGNTGRWFIIMSGRLLSVICHTEAMWLDFSPFLVFIQPRIRRTCFVFHSGCRAFLSCVFTWASFQPQQQPTTSACKWCCSQSALCERCLWNPDRKVKEGSSFFTPDRVERSEDGPAQSCQVEGSSPQSGSTENTYLKLSSLRWAFEQVIAQNHPTRINKDWKMLNAASMQVGGLWEAIWLRAWQQIPCWSNRWPSASWELQYVHKYLF